MPSAYEAVEQLELSYFVGKTIRMYNHFEKRSGSYLEKRNIHLYSIPAIPLLGIPKRKEMSKQNFEHKGSHKLYLQQSNTGNNPNILQQEHR